MRATHPAVPSIDPLAHSRGCPARVNANSITHFPCAGASTSCVPHPCTTGATQTRSSARTTASRSTCAGCEDGKLATLGSPVHGGYMLECWRDALPRNLHGVPGLVARAVAACVRLNYGTMQQDVANWTALHVHSKVLLV